MGFEQVQYDDNIVVSRESGEGFRGRAGNRFCALECLGGGLDLRQEPVEGQFGEADDLRALVDGLPGGRKAPLEVVGGVVAGVLLDEGDDECYDRVIYAIGGTTPSAFLTSSGIAIEDGKPVHDENYETNIKELYVAGDITQESGGSIALGLNHGFAIANHILKKG